MSHTGELSREDMDNTLLNVLMVNGEKQYIALICEHFTQPLRGFLWGLVAPADRESIDDILYDGFRKFLEYIRNLRQKSAYPATMKHSAFLFTIVKNVYLDEYKKKKRYKAISIEVEQDSEQTFSPIAAQLTAEGYSEKWLELKLFLEEVDQGIEQLDEKYRIVMRLIRDEDLDEEAIAQRLKRPQHTVKNWIHRGRKQLRKMYPEYSEYLQVKNRR